MIQEPRRDRPGWALAVPALVASAALLFGAPAVADRLVTRDGSIIETKSAWKVQGRLVIFELPDGQLASLQLGEVDLDASRAATEQTKAAVEKPAAAEPPKKEAVLVLTDADVRPAPPLLADTEEPGAGAAQEAASQRLVVSSWDEASEDDGLVITGELVNQSPDVAAGIQLAVLLFDREGEPLETVLATVTSQVLQPGQRARFRAEVPGVFDYSALRFEAESLGLVVGFEEEGPDDEG